MSAEENNQVKSIAELLDEYDREFLELTGEELEVLSGLPVQKEVIVWEKR